MGHRIAERVAQEIIKYYGITTPSEIDIEAIALDRRVFVNDIVIEGSVARLQVKNKFGIISVNRCIKESGKRRFAIAHELGHFELHIDKSKTYICNDRDFLNWYREKIDETEANIFAAELLMPVDMFREFCPRDEPDFNIISTLAAKFNTSLTATAFRYVEKGYFPCALVASLNGRIKWRSWSHDFSHIIKGVDTPLHEFSIAGASLGGESIPNQPKIVNEECWLDETIKDKELKLHEHSIHLPSYNTILSLLFFN
ncbi:MAG: ImmA/IrrE family metallo-endopeptidase [candidate division Zixibacteria bacterium]